MSLYEIAVATSAALLLSSAVDYVYKAVKGDTSPVPATWILMMVVMSLSLWMYIHSPQSSLAANIAVAAGFVNVVVILAGVLFTHLRQGTLRISFDPTQRICLLSGALIFGLWLVTKRPLLSYTLVQLIAIAAYIATVNKLKRASHSTEPLFLWVAALLASLVALCPAWVKKDVYAYIYLARAIPSTIIIIVLIFNRRQSND